MKMTLKHAAALLPLFAACYATAADDAGSKAAPKLPVVTVQAVTTEDSSGYATWVAMANEKFKAAGGPDHFTHVYEGIIAGEETGAVFAVRFADSAVTLAKDSAALMKLPERQEINQHLAAIRKLGPSIMLQAVHFEGGYDMANEKFKAAGGPDHFTHVYEGIIAGEETGAVFAVRFADSAVTLAKDSAALMKLPERQEINQHLAAIRKMLVDLLPFGELRSEEHT